MRLKSRIKRLLAAVDMLDNDVCVARCRWCVRRDLDPV
jgi:L-lysine 2,3-aminomutase